VTGKGSEYRSPFASKKIGEWLLWLQQQYVLNTARDLAVYLTGREIEDVEAIKRSSLPHAQTNTK
jgi:hypothetical protein